MTKRMLEQNSSVSGQISWAIHLTNSLLGKNSPSPRMSNRNWKKKHRKNWGCYELPTYDVIQIYKEHEKNSLDPSKSVAMPLFESLSSSCQSGTSTWKCEDIYLFFFLLLLFFFFFFLGGGFLHVPPPSPKSFVCSGHTVGPH